MKPLELLSFGHFIAFVLPGIVAARALAYLVPSLQRAFTALEGASSEAAGPIFLVTLAALTIGLTLNTVRREVVDPILNRVGPKRERLDYSLLTAEKHERFKDALEGVYRPYEFSANMALALLLLCVARAAWGPPQAGLGSSVTIGAGVLGVLMLVVSFSQLRETYRVLSKILQSASTTSVPPTKDVPIELGSPSSQARPPSVTIENPK